MPESPEEECDMPFQRSDEDQEWVLDVVCGMEVAPQTTPHHEHYNGLDYYFCCASCLTRFIVNPAQFLGKTAESSI